MSNSLNENALPLAFAAFVMLAGSAIYFSLGSPNSVPMGNLAAMYPGMQYKVAFSPAGEIKLFALAGNGAPSSLPAMEGSNTPSRESIVLGSTAAAMMKKEKFISGAGSPLQNFFGINTSVGGVLGKTSSPLDMLHYLSAEQFSAISGDTGRVAILLKGTMPKIFYYYGAGETVPRMALAEGSLVDYKSSYGDGRQYCPLLVGADEATMMRAEKLISGPGDKLDGFFGKNVKIVGILAKTNSPLDMMHFVPKECGLA